MGLRAQTGNMYEFVTHTWNPIRGRCMHDCKYCYMKRFSDKLPAQPYLNADDINTDLGAGNFIFVGSGTDMYAENVNREWIAQVLARCNEYPKNTYLFQSKRPGRMIGHKYPPDTVLCTTIETNRRFLHQRRGYSYMCDVRAENLYASSCIIGTNRRSVTIEPIMDFDLKPMLSMITMAGPEWVTIGADSGKNNLPEPPPGKIKMLVSALREFTTVKIKKNLHRLMR